MEDDSINIEAVVQHWVESSAQNHATMLNLIKSKEYSWALFIGHLVIEKLIKAVYVKQLHQHPMFKHDLLWLVKKTELEIPLDYIDWLDEVTTFNINARYDD